MRDEAVFEDALRALVPTPAEVDVVKAAYVAGVRAATRRWRNVCATVCLVATAPWVLLLRHQNNAPSVLVEQEQATPQAMVADATARINALATPPLKNDSPPKIPGDMWRLRAAVLEHGLDGLPNVPLPPVKLLRSSDVF